VLRLNHPLGGHAVKRIESDFADILRPGGRIIAAQALPEEANEPELLELPRLLLDFNLKDYGRLRQLIDALND
jgi:hypothetical protein